MVCSMAGRKKERKLVLSPTRIRAWLECPLQYKFTYIDRLSRFYYRANPFDAFGSTMHRTLQMFHEAGGPSTVSAESLLQTLESCWTGAGYDSAEDEQRHLEAAREIVCSYREQCQSSGAQVVMIEKQIRHHYAEFVLMGRLDRLDEHPDGTLEVIDYKSGLMEVTPEDVHDSLAMLCYSLLVSRRYPDRPVKATIVGLAGGCFATTRFSGDELDAFEDDARQVARQMLGREEFFPNYGPHCEGCIYSRKCYRGGPVIWEEARREFEESQLGAW